MSLWRPAVVVLAGVTVLTPRPVRAQGHETAADLDRIRQRLDAPSALRDDAGTGAPPTFRTSVSEEAPDIRKFWGELDAVSPNVRPNGGPWHHEFVNMVTPDEYKGYGAIFTNSEKAALATQDMLSALMFKYLPDAIGSAVTHARKQAAKREVAAALEEFYLTHPGTRPPSTAGKVP